MPGGQRAARWILGGVGPCGKLKEDLLSLAVYARLSICLGLEPEQFSLGKVVTEPFADNPLLLRAYDALAFARGGYEYRASTVSDDKHGGVLG